MSNFDAIVIGTGQAGPSLAVRLAKAGQRTLIIEKGRVGGTCVNVGCIPTKTLVASARAAHVARHAAEFGVVVEGAIRCDMAAVKARMNGVRGQSNEGVEKWLRETPGLELLFGHACMTGPRTVRVGEKSFDAARIFLNVGARPSVPPVPGLADIAYLTSTSILELDRLPSHLVILGGSYIGLEFAQMYRRFGSEVTVLEVTPQIIGREDPETSASVRALLESEGIRFVTAVSELSFAKEADGFVANCSTPSGAESISGSDLLVAVGRAPNTTDLGLDAAGVRCDARGFIEVDDQLHTTAPEIWALGDVNGKGGFTHTAYNDFEIVAANLLDGGARRVSDRIGCYALFTDPPLARIGMSVGEVRKSGRAALTARMMMSRVGRARERGETAGFMQIVIDAKSELILGATLFGIEADEAIHSLLDLMYAGASYRVLQNAMHIHPTVSELLPTLLADLAPLQA